MKKVIFLVLAFVLIFGTLAVSGYAEAGTDISDLCIRDPFVLLEDGTYYVYGTMGIGKAGYGCYTSTDLKTWYGPYCIFDADAQADFDGAGDYWAAECHKYNGSFYLLASYRSAETGYRGTSVFKSENPLGPFVEISDGHITPHGTDSIDGTLYIEDGVPYMVYVQEHTSAPDHIGGIAYARLSEDLSHFVSEPVTMFRANAPIWTDNDNSVTDGPFMYKTSSGKLIMLWSTFENGYVETTAFSSNGKLNGRWHQSSRPIYCRDENHKNDGGHGMIFTDKDGRMLIAMHSPNSGDTRVVFYEIEDRGDFVVLKGSSAKDIRIRNIDNAFFTVCDAFLAFFERLTALVGCNR